LFQQQENYFDIPISTQSPVQIRESLARLADQVLGSNESGSKEFRELLKHKTSPNGGTDVTNELKYTSVSYPLGRRLLSDHFLVKYSRQNSIHGSPTVLWDGLVANEVSSSWGEKEWLDFLGSKISA
jgi:hypothetical protein